MSIDHYQQVHCHKTSVPPSTSFLTSEQHQQLRKREPKTKENRSFSHFDLSTGETKGELRDRKKINQVTIQDQANTHTAQIARSALQPHPN